MLRPVVRPEQPDASPDLGRALHWDSACATPSTASDRTVFSGAAFTIELWLQTDAPAPMWQSVVFRGGNSENAASGWTLELTESGTDTHVLQFCGSNGTSQFACVTSSQSLAVGRPYHVAVVRLPPGRDCGAVGNGGCVKFYVAHGEGATRMHTESTKAFAVDWPSAEPMHLGAGAFDCGSYQLHADMDELRIWSSVRSLRELDAALSRAVACSESGLVSYHKFDEPSGDVLRDCTSRPAEPRSRATSRASTLRSTSSCRRAHFCAGTNGFIPAGSLQQRKLTK